MNNTSAKTFAVKSGEEMCLHVWKSKNMSIVGESTIQGHDVDRCGRHILKFMHSAGVDMVVVRI